MSDHLDAATSELQQQLTHEIARLRELAIKSTDALVVAKAIAASDLGVQQVLLAKLTSGERLIEVFVLQGAAQTELQVFFRFIPHRELVHIVDTGVLAIVDSAKGEVTGIVDPFVLQPERRVGRPFVSVSALTASALGTDSKDSGPIKQREQAFFRSLGLSQFAGGGGVLGVIVGTVVDSDITSATYSPGAGGRYVQDDTGKETVNDACDDGVLV